MGNNDDINIKNKKHIKAIYSDKASNLLRICIGISIFSFLTYLIGIFLYHSFDFGFIFEMISFIFIIFSLNRIKHDDLQSGKRNVIISMLPIGWLIIYDLINLLANIEEVGGEVLKYYTSFDQFFCSIEPYLYDITLVASIILLFSAYLDLCKADGTKKSYDYAENFYDRL